MKRDKPKTIATYIFLILMSIIFVFPFYFLAVSATNSSIDVTNGRMLPGGELFTNLKNIFSQTDMTNALKNSTVVALF